MFARSYRLLRCARVFTPLPSRGSTSHSLSTSTVVRESQSIPSSSADANKDITESETVESDASRPVASDDYSSESTAIDSEAALQKDVEEEEPVIESYRQFMEVVGHKFEHANKPNKWMGNDIPFPMNKSFRPPPPLSDAICEEIWQLHLKDPLQFTLRELAKKYHLSIGRIDAILRLKGLEKDWTKNIPLQTGFRAGMEFLLKVDPKSHTDSDTWRLAALSDEIEEEPGRQAARDRYERLYWETAEESGAPLVLPGALERSQAHAKRLELSKKLKVDDARVKARVPTPSYVLKPKPIQRLRQPGRPDLKFVDVGNKFVDEKELLSRFKEAERKVQLRRKVRRQIRQQ